jgi:type III secretory pathway component EscU
MIFAEIYETRYKGTVPPSAELLLIAAAVALLAACSFLMIFAEIYEAEYKTSVISLALPLTPLNLLLLPISLAAAS